MTENCTYKREMTDLMLGAHLVH